MRNILQIDTILEYTLPHTHNCFETLETLEVVKEKLKTPFFESLVPKQLHLCMEHFCVEPFASSSPYWGGEGYLSFYNPNP